ncbi:hypothetical protein SESBI_03682 [Sesbania bispinosa]|nr:hypothetical protein SESBI_03682 [Sesbania bispinosa]
MFNKIPVLNAMIIALILLLIILWIPQKAYMVTAKPISSKTSSQGKKRSRVEISSAPGAKVDHRLHLSSPKIGINDGKQKLPVATTKAPAKISNSENFVLKLPSSIADADMDEGSQNSSSDSDSDMPEESHDPALCDSGHSLWVKLVSALSFLFF